MGASSNGKTSGLQPENESSSLSARTNYAAIVTVVERTLGKGDVAVSITAGGTIYDCVAQLAEHTPHKGAEAGSIPVTVTITGV